MVQPFDKALRTKLEFTYVRLVQERVVEGIKHMEGGSSSFQIYYLQNITEKSNEKVIKKQLVEEYDLTPHEVERFLSVLSFVKNYRSLLNSSSSFIKKYNKGTLPFHPDDQKSLEENEVYLMRHTYFGSLVNSLYLISQSIKDLNDVSVQTLIDQRKSTKQYGSENSVKDSNQPLENKSEDVFDITDFL